MDPGRFSRHILLLHLEARRRLARSQSDQDAAQLIDASNAGSGVVYNGRDRFKRDIDNLQNAELDILLQGSCGADLHRLPQFGNRFGRQRAPLYTIIKGTPREVNCPIRRIRRIFTRFSLANSTSFATSM